MWIKNLFAIVSIAFLVYNCTTISTTPSKHPAKQEKVSKTQIPYIQPIKNKYTINSCMNNLHKGNYKQALRLGKNAVALHSNNYASYLCLSLAYALNGQYNFALTSIEQAQILASTQAQKDEVQKAKQFILQLKQN